MNDLLTARSRPFAAFPPMAAVLATTAGLLLAAVMASVLLGVRSVAVTDIWQAFTAFDPNNPEQIVIRQIRLPQTLGGLLVGASLGMAGAIMQAVTRNPLADPGLLGVNAGATAGIVLPLFLLGMTDPSAYVWPALAGAFMASSLIWALGASGLGVLGLLIAGAALSAFLFSLVNGLLLISQSALDIYRKWVLGSLQGITLDEIAALLPVFLAGFAAAAFAARFLNALALGNDLARALGTNVRLASLFSLFAITWLSAKW